MLPFSGAQAFWDLCKEQFAAQATATATLLPPDGSQVKSMRLHSCKYKWGLALGVLHQNPQGDP